MHIPPAFVEDDKDEIRRIIASHPLAAIVYKTDTALDAQHVPLIFDGQHRLIGHVAANNEICDSLVSGSDVLIIFSGQDSYISPNWYPTKSVHHRHVPTWNYQTVHVRGKLNFLTDSKTALAVVGKLTKHFETQTNGADAWKISDAPKAYISDLLSKLTPFEILIEEISAKSKLSQNREKVDYTSVRDQMIKSDLTELATRMQSLEQE